MHKPFVALVSDAADIGGAERYLETLAAALRHCCRFHVLLGDRAPRDVAERLVAAGASVERIAGLRRVPHPAAPLRLRRRLRELKPDLVHVNLTDQGDGLGTLPAARFSGLPALATLHLVIPNRTKAREAVSRRMLALPQRLICVSDAVAGYARGATDRIAVVRPGIREPRLAVDPRAELGLEGEAFVIGGIGRLDQQKGWDILCNAADRILEDLPEAVIAIVGDGPERARLTHWTHGRLRLLGPRQDASRIVRAFDILVVPSRYEAFGLVALEAMHAGVPVVASKVGGLPEALGICGTFVAPGRPDDLAEAIVALAKDSDARAEHARCGQERARTMFAVDRMAAATGNVYAALLDSIVRN